MRVALLAAIILGLISLSAQAATSIEKPPRKITLDDFNNARFVQPGCAVLAAQNQDRYNEAEKDRVLLISVWTCDGAVKAVAQLMMAEHEYCPSGDLYRLPDLYNIVDKYMKTPGNLDHPMGIVFARALREASPCPEEQATKKGAGRSRPF